MNPKLAWTIAIIGIIVIGGVVYFYYNKKQGTKAIKKNEKGEPENEQGINPNTPPDQEMQGILAD